MLVWTHVQSTCTIILIIITIVIVLFTFICTKAKVFTVVTLGTKPDLRRLSTFAQRRGSLNDAVNIDVHKPATSSSAAHCWAVKSLID